MFTSFIFTKSQFPKSVREQLQQQVKYYMTLDGTVKTKAGEVVFTFAPEDKGRAGMLKKYGIQQ